MANIANRITIQIDLSGYSFNHLTNQESLKVGLERKLLKESEGESNSLECIECVLNTHVYTLIPTSLCPEGEETSILSQMFRFGGDIASDSIVKRIELPMYDATILYSIPAQITNSIKETFGEDYGTIKVIPTIYKLIDNLQTLSDHNRVLVYWKDWSRDNHIHIVAAEGESLKLVNSYKVSDFTTALYYILMVVKEVMFNPENTTIQIYGELSSWEKSKFEKYFKGVNVHN